MDCLTDTSCLTSLLDTLNQLAATIDFCGLVLFGDLWTPIGPGLESGVESIAEIFDPLWVDDDSSCMQYAKQVTKHA